MDCARCGATLKNGQAHCASCGTAVTLQGDSIAEDEVNRLLAEANLLRIRKRYDEAIDVCTRVLRLEPANATAHALMGDVYHANGNDREALGWYKLAVQLDPTNSSDRKKLDEVIDRVFHKALQSGTIEAVLPVSEKAMTTPKTTRSSAIRAKLEKVTPLHVTLVTVVLIVAAVTVIMYKFESPKRQPTPPKQGSPSASTNSTPSPANTTPAPNGQSPLVAPPTADTVEGARIPGLPIIVKPSGGDDNKANERPSTNQQATPPASNPGAVQVPPFEPQSPSRLSADDLDKQTQQIQQALDAEAKSLKLPSTLQSVLIDPRSRMLTIYYSIPPMQSAVETKQGLLYTGFKLVWAAERVNATLRSFELRGYAYSGDNRKDASLAIIANVSQQQADDALGAGDYRTVAKYLTNPWWRGDLDQTQL